jgi:uncharacterized protein YqeY
MTLKEKINADFTQAYKEKNFKKKDLLSVIKAEISRGEAGLKTYADSDVIQLIKKLVESNKIVGSEETIAENIILEAYLPKQMDSELIRKEIQHFVSFEDNKNIGKIMKHFKDNYEGQYDGKVVSAIAKEIMTN